jgi:formylglycine-generating enzyme required for sulfatase activity
MIRRLISILIGLAGSALLYSWWLRGQESVSTGFLPPATVLVEPGQPSPAEAPADEPAEGSEPPPGEAEMTDVAASPLPEADWAPTLVEFDQSDRNGVTVVLQRADAALAQGRLFRPSGDNAVDLFVSVLTAAPGNARARSGLVRTMDRLALDMDAAMARGDYPAASRMWPVLRQLRTEQAADLSRWRSWLDAGDAQRTLLEQAVAAMERGRLDGGRRSAAALYREVLELEPGNLAAQGGLAAIRDRLLAQAHARGEEGAFEDAEALIERAQAVTPEALLALVEARSALVEQRNHVAAVLLSQAHQRLDEGQADAAESILEQALSIAPEHVGSGLVRERIRNVRLYGGYGEGERFRDQLTDGSRGPMLVVVPVGSFLMGSPEDEPGRRNNEGPRFRVRFDQGFALAEAEITVGEFRRFVEATGHRTRAEREGRSSVYDERSGSMRERSGMNWRHDETGRTARDEFPVVHVDWNDAQAFATWLAESTGRPYRLPSEAEFEYALRAGSTDAYPWGSGAPAQALANVSSAGDRSRSRREWSNAFPDIDDGHFGIAPVRGYAANAFGLHDMVGNVSEWVEDCWHSTYARAPSDGRAWVNPGCSRRVVRGSSWASGPDQVRAAYRLNIEATTTSPRVGFRVARDLSMR